jgi:hypothetical protein
MKPSTLHFATLIIGLIFGVYLYDIIATKTGKLPLQRKLVR